MSTTDFRVHEFKDVIEEELRIIKAKRANTNPEDGADDPQKNLFGIALSGGGIRSAIVNLGALEVFNEFGILKRTDYLSSVSGGGYIGGYVHAKLRKSRTAEDAYRNLFSPEDIKYFKKFGDYLSPGKTIVAFINYLRIAGAFIFSLMMNWIWVLALLMFLSCLTMIAGDFFGACFHRYTSYAVGCYIAIIILFIITIHYFFFWLRNVGFGRWRLWSSNTLNYIEGIITFITIIYLFYKQAEVFSVSSVVEHLIDNCFFVISPQLAEQSCLLVSLIILIIIGFFANPNILTFHRFYRDRLASAFLATLGKKGINLKLHELMPSPERSEHKPFAPYPLINTCLNLLGEKDNRFTGTGVSNYFLLSPLYCGSRLTSYASTSTSWYRSMTLSTAVAVSGAAVNPAMGTKTNKVLAFFMTLLNLRLGYWAVNPRENKHHPLTWWPYYHLKELFSRTDSKTARVNLSDGGHIENLGVYELFRRKCKLIIAIDVGADPDYNFSDLNNLVVRARNELGITIDFRPFPEDVIRPLPSKGFSKSHFVVGAIGEIENRSKRGEEYTGVFVYIKASLKEPRKWWNLTPKDYQGNSTNYDSFHYKTYHPDFPHESTADQFFDEKQWEAYHQLGRFMIGDLFSVDLRPGMEEPVKVTDLANKSITELSDFLSGKT